MNRLIKDDDPRTRIGRAAGKRAAENFDIKNMIGSVKMNCRELMEE